MNNLQKLEHLMKLYQHNQIRSSHIVLYTTTVTFIMNTTDIVIEITIDVNACADKLYSEKKDEEKELVHSEQSKAIKMTGEEKNICVICIEEINGEQSPCAKFNCGHELHAQCALLYVTDRLKHNHDILCPTCRHNECANDTQTYAEMRDHFGIAPPRKKNDAHTMTGLELTTHNIAPSRPANDTHNMAMGSIIVLARVLIFALLVCGMSGIQRT